MRRQRLFLAVLLAIITVGAFVSPLVQAAGGVGGRPANPDPDNPRTQSIFIYNLKPGESKKDSIFLSNGSDEDQTVEIYPVDGVLTNMGSYTCEQKVEERQMVGAWVKLDKNEVTIPARGDTTIGFTVTVPQRVDVGEHNGCIAIQRIDGDDDDQIAGGGAIQLKTRQAVRMAVTIPGDIHRKVGIDSFQRIKTENLPQFDINLINSGNVSADVDINIETKDMFGNTVYSNGGQYVSIGDSKLRLLFDDAKQPFWGGYFTSKASIAYDKRAGVYGTLDKNQLVYEESKPVSYFVWPSIWAIILGVSALLFLVGVFMWLRQQKGQAKSSAKRSLSKPAAVWAKYTVKQGDTIASLARKHGTTASKIATINKISTSADLKAGQSIYIPKKG